MSREKGLAADFLILCGGLGTRFRQVDAETPKVMAHMNGRPFLNILLEHYAAQGFHRFVLCTGYKADVVEDTLEVPVDVEVVFSREDEPLGTGGAVKQARRHVISRDFFVANGDSLSRVDCAALLKMHRTREALVTMAVARVPEDQPDFGAIALLPDGAVSAFEEKGRDGGPFANAGIYCFSSAIFAGLPASNTFSLERDIFPGLVGNGLFGYSVPGQFCDIGTPERYKNALRQIRSMTHED